MAGTPQSLTLKLYQAVISDVINNVKEAFQEEGVDDQVLQELKTIWESKLTSSKALESIETETETHKLPDQKTVQVYQQPRQQQQQQQQQHQQNVQQMPPQQSTPQQHQQMPQQSVPPMQQQMPNSNTVSVPMQDLNKKIPIQITLPPQHGSADNTSRVITIQVPASTLQGNQLQSVLGGTVITAAMSVPTDVATVLLQQHVDNVLQHQQQQAQAQAQGKVFSQYDGVNDSSDDDDDDDDDDKDDDDEEDDDDDQDIDDDDEENDENEGIEDEPLNSSDDVSEEDPALFDTDNIVVCQYDKITRSRNKWKFYLKDGIMNLNGKDFVFLKANGEADW